MGVAEDHHAAAIRKALKEPAALFSLLPLQGFSQGPIADDGLRFGKFVKDVDKNATPRFRDGRRKPKDRGINVALHRMGRRQQVKLVKHCFRTNVASVQNLVNAL